MPTYVYRCQAKHETTLVLPIGQAPTSVKCQECETSAPRSYEAPAVTFKGPGFASTEPKF